MVKKWHTSHPDLYCYLRNEMPMKTSTITLPTADVASAPHIMRDHLAFFWSQIESWTHENAMDSASESLEDHWVLYLPREDVSCDLTARDLADQAKPLKNTAPGLDAWTRTELRSGPLAAWDQLLHVIRDTQGRVNVLPTAWHKS